MTRHNNIVILVLMAASLSALRAAETNVAGRAPGGSRLNLDSFRIISERNIFNPNRYPGQDNRNTRREPDRRSRSESFALVGTMSFEKGRFAFFDGSNSDYRRVLGANENIAGYTIAAVTPDHVTLQSTNQQEIKLPVGMQMRKFEEGDWQLSERTEVTTGAGSPGSPTAAGSTPGTPGGDEEVLKRMMQRREQEGGAPPTAPAPPEPTANNERAPAQDSGSGPEAEILRRLQEQRERELQR